GTKPELLEIPVVPSDLSQLRTKLTDLPVREITDELQRTLTVVERLTTHLDSRIDGLSNNANRSMEAVTQTLTTTDSAVRQLQAEASATLHHLDSLIVDAQHRLDTGSGDLNRTLRTADRAAREAEKLLVSLNSMTGPRARMRGNLEATLRDLAASASSLRNFSRTIERNPSVFLTGRSAR
ncbi:MAG TPA: paraquat-inducible protein B, partial [Rhodopila sp.]|nr:paraquat-inducible protein B [Rhodopila sp.]